MLPFTLISALTPSLCDPEVYSIHPCFHEQDPSTPSFKCRFHYVNGNALHTGFREAKISLQRLHLHADTLPNVHSIYTMSALENYRRMLILSAAERVIVFQRSRLPSEEEFQKLHQLLRQAEEALPN